ncbi:MAG: NAD-dependent epimerase/dehydratase family protein [Polyangiaceae bacterium]
MSELHLVTGGAGYFGEILVRRLADRRDTRVRIFDINEPDDAPPGVEHVRGDIRDASAVRSACAGASVVHHNVAMVPLAKDARAFSSVNVGGTEKLLDACLAERVRKVVYVSSSAVFGAPSSNPVTEETPPNPSEPYGRAKLAGEKACAAARLRGLDVSIIRPRTILGHGRLGIMQILFEWVLAGTDVPVLGRGDNRYQFVHADDLADACLRAADRATPGTYNIGAAVFGTMRETLQALVDHARTGSRVVSVPAMFAVRAMDLTSRLGISPLGAYHSLMYGREMFFDLTRAQRELGYSPRFSNAQMICESYDWYVAHRAEVLARTNASHHRGPVRQGALRAFAWAARFLPEVRSE